MMSQPKKITNEIFRKNLEALMTKFGATQEMVANDLGVSQSAMSNYLNGRIPRADTLLEIASYFNVSPSDLVGGDAAPTAKIGEGLFGGDADTLLADLQNDLASAESAILDAEAALKKSKVSVGVAKLTVARLKSIRKTNSRRST